MQRKGPKIAMPPTMLLLIVGLIIVSTALFVTGLAIEHTGSAGSAAVSSHHDAGKTANVHQDADGGHDASSVPQGSQKVQEGGGSHNEIVFGIDIENPWFVAAFVLSWLVLVVALIRFRRTALLAVIIVAIAAMILDVGEVVRKVGVSNSIVATFAVLVAVAHMLIAVLAVLMLARGYRPVTVQQR